mmetsp:Transcript_69466/g.122862  ORF Transcript_69466/g.122862 Transcript_69466/m.122862 type:complete len:99 (+) Transcript_69466:85-381(+)
MSAQEEGRASPHGNAGESNPQERFANRCFNGLLDFLAVLLAAIQACFSAIWRLTKEFVIYPVKEFFLERYDGAQEHLYPYKQGRKVPFNYTEVPSFRL